MYGPEHRVVHSLKLGESLGSRKVIQTTKVPRRVLDRIELGLVMYQVLSQFLTLGRL